MPDLLSVAGRRWKLVLLLTFLATTVALIASLLSPKQYLGVATALPANSVLGDKARIFNQNIEALYTVFGSTDELDKIEGTATLDTIYLAAARDFHLAAHYGLAATDGHATEIAAMQLRKKASVKRTGYGELKVKVWDRNSGMAAALANALLQKLNDIHRQLQTENNKTVLQRLKEDYAVKQQALRGTPDTLASGNGQLPLEKNGLPVQLQQYAQLIGEYELAVKTTPNALLVVEPARPQFYAGKPDVQKTVLFTLLASGLFSILLALFIETRKQPA